jgi:adenylyltransferase/sulfurtransferase
VIVIGAGGLGCPVLQYLCGAGVGTLGIIDDDIVSLENLHRQIIYRTADVGKPKAVCAEKVLRELNPEINIRVYHKRLTNQNALEILEDFDVVVDGTDNLTTRYLINDACVILNKPLVYGAVSQFEGQVAVFNFPLEKNRTASYRDLFPEPPQGNEMMNCEETGVLGVLPGIIGMWQANETIKILTGIGTPLINSLLIYHALKNQFIKMEIHPRAVSKSRTPENRDEFIEFDYDFFCSSDSSSVCREISVSQLEDLLDQEGTELLDIRESGNIPDLQKCRYVQIPYTRLDKELHQILGKNVIVVCQRGLISKRAGKKIAEIFNGYKRVYSLRGGIAEWNKYIAQKDYESEKK